MLDAAATRARVLGTLFVTSVTVLKINVSEQAVLLDVVTLSLASAQLELDAANALHQTLVQRIAQNRVAQE